MHRQGRRSSGVKLGEGPVSLTKRQWSRQAPSRVFPRLDDSSILSFFTLTPDIPLMSTSFALLLWPLHCQRFLASHAHNNNLFLLGNGSPRVCSRSLDFAPLLYAPKIELATSARKVLHLGPNQLHYHGAVQFNGAFTMTVGSLIGDLSIHASLLLESSIALQFGLSCMYSISVAWSLNLA